MSNISAQSICDRAFSLQPFAPSQSLPNLQITGNIARTENHLTLHYALVGDLKAIEIAAPSQTPTRQHELWQHTCFEFFLGLKNSPRYWEFNLSPARHWNVYRFDAYRQGMQAELAFITLPFRVEQQPDSFRLALDINLDNIVLATQQLDVAITTVIKYKNSEITYWALTHQGAEADFHLRDSFTIEL